jgi:molybdopterin-guanine dinucleotide biosynthesis protein A
VASATATPKTDAPYTALVLAGSRTAKDAFAESQGQPRKALVPVAGIPMIVRVVRALAQATDVGDIHLRVDDLAPLRALPELRALEDGGRLVFGGCASSPTATVLRHLAETPPTGPLLIVAGDHALLERDMVEHFCRAARRTASDVVVAMVAARVVHARYPDVSRTWIQLRDGAWKGANMFALFSPAAAAAATVFGTVERYRKRPWRLVAALGPVTLARFALRRLDLAETLARASAVIGVRVASVEMPFAECAIDVDRVTDLALATRIAEARDRTPGTSRPSGVSPAVSV